MNGEGKLALATQTGPDWARYRAVTNEAEQLKLLASAASYRVEHYDYPFWFEDATYLYPLRQKVTADGIAQRLFHAHVIRKKLHDAKPRLEARIAAARSY